jgi:peptidyl-prolyl cis-trans isomerase D
MLEFFREKIKGPLATVLVVFFCAIFALWGVEQLFQGGAKPTVVATVNGEEITDGELKNAVSMLREQYTRMLGGKVDPGFLNDKMLREPALESLIDRRLLEAFAKQQGMTVSDTLIEKEIVADKTFSRDEKTFDPEYFKERLRSAGMTPMAYREAVRKQMVLEQIQQSIGATAFVTQTEVMDIARLNAQKRSFEFVRLPLKAAADAMSVTDEAIAKYHQDHQSEFMTEEQVSIQYLEVNKKELASSIQLDEAEVTKAYENEAAAFMPETELRASHILVEESEDGSHEKKLSDASKKLADGIAFEEVAKEYSIDEGSATEGGDVGFTSGKTFVPEFEAALSALVNVGDVSAPVKTEFGYHIIKLTEKRSVAMKPFEERKPELENEMRAIKAGELYGEKVSALGDATYSAGDLTDPSASLGMPIQKTAPFGRRGGPGIAADQKVIEAAFSPDVLDSGKNSQVIELGGERAVVIRVVQHDTPKLRDLAEVKPVIVDTLKQESAARQFAEKMLTLKQRAESEGNLTGIAKDEKLSVTHVDGVSRTQAGEQDPEVVDQAFAIPRDLAAAQPVQVLKLSNGDLLALKLIKVEDVAVADDAPEVAELRKRMESEIQEREFQAFQNSLRKKATIVRSTPAEDAPVTP